ncbi:hypothetical protein JAAARDRAFT_187583 [Jaapia argillacea MUCL 33604]|uniref:Uncharacterized protein n=1 Tax=Jaapia argillacea MUCL 33604 TaxID=933084 RepID=A0A067QDH0_9AGAM|nr:hypothetical protein JAAARDRAFT_187583 [Jaapia argillacea MUCL 33604]
MPSLPMLNNPRGRPRIHRRLGGVEGMTPAAPPVREEMHNWDVVARPSTRPEEGKFDRINLRRETNWCGRRSTIRTRRPATPAILNHDSNLDSAFFRSGEHLVMEPTVIDFLHDRLERILAWRDGVYPSLRIPRGRKDDNTSSTSEAFSSRIPDDDDVEQYPSPSPYSSSQFVKRRVRSFRNEVEVASGISALSSFDVPGDGGAFGTWIWDFSFSDEGNTRRDVPPELPLTEAYHSLSSIVASTGSCFPELGDTTSTRLLSHVPIPHSGGVGPLQGWKTPHSGIPTVLEGIVPSVPCMSTRAHFSSPMVPEMPEREGTPLCGSDVVHTTHTVAARCIQEPIADLAASMSIAQVQFTHPHHDPHHNQPLSISRYSSLAGALDTRP